MPRNRNRTESDVEAGEPDDALEIARAKRGDHAAFRALYQRHLGMVKRLARRLCPDPDRCDDLVQESFIALWHALPDFRGESRLATYCHRIATRRIWQELRRDRHDLWLDEANLPGSPDASDIVATRIDLELAIARLPTGARTVVMLRELEGLSIREIAERLDRSPGTIKSQLHRARALLMRTMQ